MYLPIIMIRHFGWPGFLVFAIPNVAGCAGFGYACPRADSERLCREHSSAMVAFSAVTIAYQIFFIAWIVNATTDATTSLPRGWMAAGGALAVGVILSIGRGAFWPALGSAAAVASLTLWAILPVGRIAALPATGDLTSGELGMNALLYTAPIIAFGFLLCPWLDRTFHRARQSTPSVHAFGVFGVAFGCIIVLTAAYTVNGALVLVPAVAMHLAVQTTFTIATHLREVRLAAWPSGSRTRPAVIVAPAILGAFAADLPFPFEATYLVFLGFYGLVFPAYVLLFMRTERPLLRAWPMKRTVLIAFAVLVTALAPFAALGFLAEKTWLLPLPVVMLVLVALIAPRTSRRGA
ncbi:MAG: hypothetical protein SGJ09_12710 [Phycisphaerae bacterium]|nr:hypothetical protein [Phycisphaerae bacterium]